nr:MAG TPA: zinc finger domain protein [Caudoviricetes sp.]
MLNSSISFSLVISGFVRCTYCKSSVILSIMQPP